MLPPRQQPQSSRVLQTSLPLVSPDACGSPNLQEQGTNSEVFLHKRCRNIACGSRLPAENCSCEPCATKSGFCNLCMCMVCLGFYFEVNTCWWIGCDVCTHWAHTDCAIRNGLIGSGPDVKSGSTPLGMLFRCSACGHCSELLVWVRDVFLPSAPSWDRKALIRALHLVSRIFRGSENPIGLKLFLKCEELIDKLKGGVHETMACVDIFLMLLEEHFVVRHISSSDKISLRDVARERVGIISKKMQHLPREFLEKLKNELRVILKGSGGSIHRDEFLFLQKLVHTRRDLTDIKLTRAHRVQLEILVAIKSGSQDFLHPSLSLSRDAHSGHQDSFQISVSLSQASLCDVLLNKRCKNVTCRSPLPATDCDCELCAMKSGFCNLCMCMVCHGFDKEVETCCWIGCDHCEHWTHTDCAIRSGLIGTRPGAKNGSAPSDMIFWCRACCHNSELLDWVKEVFRRFATSWDTKTLIRELDFVRRIFRESEDPRGRKLFWKCEEIIDKLKIGLAETTAREHIFMLLFHDIYHTYEIDDLDMGVDSPIQDGFTEDTSVGYTEDTHNFSVPSVRSELYINIQATYGGQLISFLLSITAGFLELNQKVSERLNIGVGTFLIQYLDEENDWILITCDDDLRHYLSTATSSGDSTLRMSVELKCEYSNLLISVIIHHSVC